MKNFISLFLAFALLFSITACNAAPSEEADPSADPQPQITVTTTADAAEQVYLTGIPNLIGRAPKDIDVWTVETVTNYVPFTPDGYKGQMAEITRDYTDKSGKTTQRTYNVAFLNEVEQQNDYEHDSAMMTDAVVNGEKKMGVILMKRETLFFLERERLDGSVTRYFLDIDLPVTMWYAVVLDATSEKVLIAAGSYLFTYTFDSKQCELITDSALEYKYLEDTADGVLLFTDWDHIEHACNWTKSPDTAETGNTVITYRNADFELREDPSYESSFESDFKVMQDALRAGYVDEDYFSHMYPIYYNGGVYDISGYYLSNIHLPKPFAYNSNVFFPDSFGCWATEKNFLTLYYYGETVRSYDVGDGLWNIIYADLDYQEKPNSALWVGYDMDTDNNGVLTAKELDEGIISVQLLLYNAKDKCVYQCINGQTPVKLAEDVIDYCYAYGELYWMNSMFEAYELSWRTKTVSVLIGEDVVGISKHTDERAGFVVKPDDPRCNAESDGFCLCTLYGDDWLNQESTSGAWALEHDWDN